VLDDRTDAIVEFSNEMHRSASDAHIAEVTLIIDGRTLRSSAAGISYQAALDDVVDKVERRAVEYKSKPRVRARPDEEKQLLRQLADGTAEPGRERRIVKVKRFAIEPMFEEDALAQMEDLGHRFFVFVNAETERVAILYARDDGDYGLIEPIVGGEYTISPGNGRGTTRGGSRHQSD
jgi:putative sigma-54 modulation protein